MRVVYRASILERIRQERQNALAGDREIEKIVLTVAEARQLLRELRGPYLTATECEMWRWLQSHEYDSGPQPKLTVLGIDIEVSR